MIRMILTIGDERIIKFRGDEAKEISLINSFEDFSNFKGIRLGEEEYKADIILDLERYEEKNTALIYKDNK